MINLDERYLSYMDGSKKMRIDGIEEKVESYGWHCDGNDIKGHYVTTENYKLFYNLEGGGTQRTGTECCVNEFLSDIIGV